MTEKFTRVNNALCQKLWGVMGLELEMKSTTSIHERRYILGIGGLDLIGKAAVLKTETAFLS